ncbi:DNA-3-methyladenine glycosylase [Luteitalea sp. TBR-22]|uniref:DNA-3-methyladenine glycosylase I n=1 Tax=Luteitalea sp. TBR-22 TaxID=2802971 RepID=UPI001AF42A51|nr:DNA-3-methyladenine glycosylase I [Luteitalea sp. TBR-22]BCS32835.1 DNA-3-methyladenine glycosylase [Luteitalea sp. TBR-22]
MLRCSWCGTDPLYVAYHDEEWGVPLHDDRALFELLILEGAQAGLSWLTVLRKRPAYREAFHGFDIARVAAYGEEDVARLLANPGIVRNRLKVRGAIRTARAVLDLQAAHGSLDAFLWAFVGGTPRINRPATLADVPTVTREATAMSRALVKAGATFVGPTICYAFMQAAGLVNDHVATCWKAPAA